MAGTDSFLQLGQELQKRLLGIYIVGHLDLVGCKDCTQPIWGRLFHEQFVSVHHVIHAIGHQKSKLKIAANIFYTFWLIHLSVTLVIAPNKYCA